MKPKKILIADDDAHIRKALRIRLRQWGHVVVEVSDGLAALTQATRHNVDAIILDHEMPLGQGREIAAVIRRECHAPIILFSGHDREAFRETVYRLPDVYFLPKPLDAEKLGELLGACLGHHSAWSNAV